MEFYLCFTYSSVSVKIKYKIDIKLNIYIKLDSPFIKSILCQVEIILEIFSDYFYVKVVNNIFILFVVHLHKSFDKNYCCQILGKLVHLIHDI